MKENKDRQYQIAAALFDNYVKKTIIERYYVIDENKNFNEQELESLAAKMIVNPGKLHDAIAMALGRIAKEPLEISRLSKKEEMHVMKQAAKLRIRQSAVVLDNYKRELPRLVKEINHANFNVRLTLNEVMAFIKPLFIEVINEILAPTG